MLPKGLILAAIVLAPSVAPAIEIDTQEHDGLRIMFLTGEFTSEDDPRNLASAIATGQPDVVSFNSSGGNIYAAMEFGRMIRLHGLLTVQPRALDCASACALAFLGGVERFAEPGSIGMHKSSFVDNEALSAEDAASAIQSATADVLAYLAEMNVDPGLLQLALRYESWDVRYLSGSEMEQHRVVTAPWGDKTQSAERSTGEDALASRPPPPDEPTKQLVSPEDARGALVRREKGYALLMAEPSTGAAELRVLENGERISILGTTSRWYRVETGGGQRGWVHHTWVKVDEYYDGGFEAKHVQIKSFDNAREVQSYLVSSPLPLDAYIATNGWFAITLDGTYREDEAARLLGTLKANGEVPSDSYQTYGNTYMQKLCCE